MQGEGQGNIHKFNLSPNFSPTAKVYKQIRNFAKRRRKAGINRETTHFVISFKERAVSKEHKLLCGTSPIVQQEEDRRILRRIMNCCDLESERLYKVH